MNRYASLIFLACFYLGLPISRAQEPIFVDFFEEINPKWKLVQGRKISSEVTEGVLEIRSKTKSLGHFILIPMPKESKKDFDLEVTITQVKGKKNMAYGLCWGAKEDQTDFMGFFLSSNGKYTILARYRSLFQEIKRWTESKLVNGPRRPNHLKITRRGKLYIYYLNGKRVFASEADRLIGKGMGIALYGKMRIEVDNFILSYPDSESENPKEVLGVKGQ